MKLLQIFEKGDFNGKRGEKITSRSHLRVHGECVQLVLLVRLGFAFKVPAHLGNRAALNGGRDPDWISGADTHQLIGHHVNCNERWNCQEETMT